MPRKTLKKPPVKPPQSKQYDLFSTFFGEKPELSNTIELWDAIPKYSVSPRSQNALRSTENRLPVHEYRFIYATRHKGQRIESTCRVAVQPAAVKTKDGYIDFYPSTDEELVEEVIRKIFADQQCGIHDPSNTESWVRFSVQMIRKELKARGKTRSLDEIKRSIDILTKAHISLFLDDTEEAVYSAPILSDVTRVTRQKYLNDASLTWIARLPALVSKSVNELTYRQFNYGVLMSLSTQLARWLHKRLSHNYTFASILDNYEILYTTIQRDSGLLTQMRTDRKSKKRVPNTSANIKILEAVFDDLKANKILHSWERLEERREGRKITNIKYSLHAHNNFIKEVKAANKRLKDSRSLLLDASVDNSLSCGR